MKPASLSMRLGLSVALMGAALVVLEEGDVVRGWRGADARG